MSNTLPESPMSHQGSPGPIEQHPALVLLWSRGQPHRVGELTFVPKRSARAPWVLGRELGSHLHLSFVQQRPDRVVETGPLESPRISRAQLNLWGREDGSIRARNVGQCRMVIGGEPVDEAVLRPGDLVELKNEAVLMCAQRPSVLPGAPPGVSLASFTFGGPDPYGLVGESPAAWALRSRVGFVAGREVHVLVLGASGTGKELVARALHLASSRGARALISRNAATFPEGLIDAELFGNLKGYPNPGMVERPGLVGEADGSSLFLDELGELPHGLQAHLLRLMDQGEYQRLGEARVRRADVRLIAATNRPASDLKHDLTARFGARLALPDLNQRREDIPLLITHIMRGLAARDGALAERFLMDEEGRFGVRITPGLVAALVAHTYTTHVRELTALLWQAMGLAAGHYLDVHPELHMGAGPSPRPPRVQSEPAGALSEEVVRQRLEENDCVVERTWPALGLPNRYALYRLMKRYGLRGRGR